MQSFRLPCSLALALVLAGCASQPTVEPRPMAREPALKGHDWRLVAAPGMAAGASLPGVGAGAATLRFEEGRFSLGGPCNRHTGVWALEDGRIRFGGEGGVLASTRMMCPPEIMAREQALLAALQQPMLPEVEGPFLRLVAADGGHWRFDSRDVPPAEGRERIVQVAAQRAPCTGVVPGLCLQIRTQPGAAWQLHYGEIEGFDWQVGVEYVIRVRELPVANPPADGSSLRWVLQEILERSPPE